MTRPTTAQLNAAYDQFNFWYDKAKKLDEELAKAEKRIAELEAKLSRMPRACDGKEQDSFIKFALNNKFSTECHPLHFLFLDKQTSAARRAWGAAIAYCRDTVEGDE
ncbi:nucleotide exchange factor GrpE [Serratia liquefaciens]|uniref:hypothetical protein n=1 Tax=Serratia liquefaciens TaxID=614 RepID=UPI00061B851C|nr:hypothetical protein [Serratia liquefaciens]AKE09169.1 hypothetical protein XJ20_04400 [Serratia liquefaciens]